MITVQISVGELLDKYSILQIKKKKVRDGEKLKKVEHESKVLAEIALPFLDIETIYNLYKDLEGVNLQLWDVEDDIRILEQQKLFNDTFVKLARSVYYLNDERFNIKNKINMFTNSDIQEVKQYIDYK